MSPAELRDRCLSFAGAEETFPFGQETSVSARRGAAHAAVLPGYHLNKRHWNTVIIDGSLTRYGHVVDELEDQPRSRPSRPSARPVPSLFPSQFPTTAEAARGEGGAETKKPRRRGASSEVELGGLEPPTSWVRSRRSPN
jgi:hypothetical protein